MPICFLHGPDDPTLYLYDTPLKIVYSFLYLGTIVNSELSWKENFDKRIKSGRKILTRFTAAAGKKWGPSVEMQLWLLNFIIMQHVGFGSFLFHNFLKTPYAFQKLQSLARVAYLHTSPARIHTPIAGFQMILGQMPPVFRLHCNNLMTWLRLNNYKTVPENFAILPQHLKDIYEDFKTTGLTHCTLDEIPRITNDIAPDVNISDGFSFDIPTENDVSIFTDGSKYDEEGKWGTGAGFVIMLHDQVVAGNSITLCYTKTVFVAEVIAITSSLRVLLDKLNDGTIPRTVTITIYSNSQSANKALTSMYIHTRTRVHTSN
jgi:hypothetical protein